MIKSMIRNAATGNVVNYYCTFFENPCRLMDMRNKAMLKQVVIKLFDIFAFIVI